VHADDHPVVRQPVDHLTDEPVHERLSAVEVDPDHPELAELSQHCEDLFPGHLVRHRRVSVTVGAGEIAPPGDFGREVDQRRAKAQPGHRGSGDRGRIHDALPSATSSFDREKKSTFALASYGCESSEGIGTVQLGPWAYGVWGWEAFG